MKLKLLAVVAASIGAAPAFAQTAITAAPFNVPSANIIYVSGASALSASLASIVAKNCTGGVANTTNLAAGSPGRIVVCNTGSVDASFPGQKFAVVKRDTDGSFAGVNPVIDATPFSAPLTPGGWPNQFSCTLTNATTGTCTGTDNNLTRVPQAGLSDVDVNVWRGLNNTGELNPAGLVTTASYVSVAGVAGQGFGIMSSDALYRAMQAKQVNAGTLPATCSTIAAPGATVASVAAADVAFTPGACQPSISKEEYAAVVDGTNFAYVANGALSGDTNPINLCRRVETSGTQATSTAYFLNNPCANASPTFGGKPTKKVDLINSATAVAFNTANVVGNYDNFGGAFGLFEGSGTGDARNCVIRRNLGQNPNAVAEPALGNYAIGFLSLENNAPGVGWKYLKLDGISPNASQVPGGAWVTDANRRLNVLNGKYDLSPELEYIRPLPAKYAANGTTASIATFLQTFATNLADPTAVNTPGLYQVNGTFTNASFPTQVHKGTRGGNFCAPMTLAE